MYNGTSSDKPKPNQPCWCGSGRKYKHCHMHKDRIQALSGVVEEAPKATVEPGVVSPMRDVPAEIPRPDYAETGSPKGGRRSNLIKDEDTIARMRRTCAAARRVLKKTISSVKPGMTTDEVDAIAHQAYIDEGGYPSPLNYHHFPKSICTSVNEVICHGIPDSRELRDGDIMNVDVTIFKEGVHGDCSVTIPVGEIDDESRQLIDVTHQCLLKGMEVVRPGAMVREIGRAIEQVAARAGFGVVRAFVGHGIGETFHMDPQVPHYFDQGAKMVLKPGMTFTIEPMINVGTWRHEQWDDNWTAVTADRKRSAQFEHTLLVTDTGYEVLTLETGEAP